MDIIIRKVTETDYERLSYIMDQVQMLHVEWRPDVYKEVSPLITKAAFDDILQEDMWYVAEVDGAVVGILELVERHVENPSHVTKNILYISTMAVDEGYRGKGVGHAFFEKIKELKVEKGFDSIELQVNAKNVQAYEMYKKCGFTEKSINMEL